MSCRYPSQALTKPLPDPKKWEEWPLSAQSNPLPLSTTVDVFSFVCLAN